MELGQPHHDGSPLYAETADPGLGDRVTVWARVPREAGVTEVHVRTTPDAEPAWTEAKRDRTDGHADWWRAEIEVVNPLTSYRFLLHGPGGDPWLTAAGVVDRDPTDATDFRLSAHPAPPAWAQDAVCYQVFPDRFARAHADKPLPAWALPAVWDDPVATGRDEAMHQLYGGDLDGVTARLKHIDDLGCNLLYLTPFFPAKSNHRYNATSFEQVDPLLGGDASLVRLTEAAHGRGMRVIGDLTLNHCGDQHAWFRTARADPESAEAGWFFFTEHPDDYHMWLDVTTLPKFDLRSETLRRALIEGPDSVAARWLRPPFDLDGWRIDVANMAGRFGAVDVNASVARALAATIRDVRPAGLLLAEHAHDATADLDGSGWHGTMNYAGFTRPAWFWLGRPDPRIDVFGMPVPLPRFTGVQAAGTVDAFRAGMPWRSWVHSLTLLA
jgi:alpha-glucosidase